MFGYYLQARTASLNFLKLVETILRYALIPFSYTHLCGIRYDTCLYVSLCLIHSDENGLPGYICETWLGSWSWFNNPRYHTFDSLGKGNVVYLIWNAYLLKWMTLITETYCRTPAQNHVRRLQSYGNVSLSSQKNKYHVSDT